jgi:uncharacterized membrane protein HdeD (DUF308 family)
VTAEATSFETKQMPWWLILIGGILTVIIGIFLLTSPVKTTVALVWALGLYWVISGIFTLIGMFLDHTAWGWKLFIGILSIIAGIWVVRHPIVSAATIPMLLILLLGIQGIITGVISLILAFRGGGWGAGILGAISIVFGIILVLNWTSPGLALTLVWVVGIFAVVGGIVQIVQAFRQRSA